MNDSANACNEPFHTYRYRSLAMRVVAVAVMDQAGEWRAYIDAVPGKKHDDEYMAVAHEGDKLPKEVATALFPDIANHRWAI